MNKPTTHNAQIRRDLAISLKIQGLTYAAISSQMDISRQRVQQMVRPSVQIKYIVHKRAKGRCERCGAMEGHGHLHHVTAVTPYNTAENLLYLCRSCHKKEHKLPKRIKPIPAWKAERPCYNCGLLFVPFMRKNIVCSRLCRSALNGREHYRKHVNPNPKKTHPSVYENGPWNAK